MSDNPFAEPDDNDRTVVRGPGAAPPPRPQPAYPAAARPTAPVGATPGLPGAGAPAGRAEAAPRLAGEAEALPKVGVGPLAAAAQPLLDLLGAPRPMPAWPRPRRARNCANAPCAPSASSRPTPPPPASPPSRCAPPTTSCAPASTTWCCPTLGARAACGRCSRWSRPSTRRCKSGDRFFDVLAGMQKDPGRWKDALEVTYLCLSLGFQGRYRLSPRGASELDRIREGLYQLLVAGPHAVGARIVAALARCRRAASRPGAAASRPGSPPASRCLPWAWATPGSPMR